MGLFGALGIQWLEKQRPIQCNRHCISWEHMGPINAIGIMPLGDTWAHSIQSWPQSRSGDGPMPRNKHPMA